MGRYFATMALGLVMALYAAACSAAPVVERSFGDPELTCKRCVCLVGHTPDDLRFEFGRKLSSDLAGGLLSSFGDRPTDLGPELSTGDPTDQCVGHSVLPRGTPKVKSSGVVT